MLFSKRERAIRRILVVEDEPLVAFDNEHLLGEAGYEVVSTVDSLAEALEVLEKEELDLILSDVALRGEGDGLDLARVAAEKDVPLLFVTGNCPPAAKSLAIGCLAKPYSDKALKSALDAVDARLRGKDVKKVPAGLTLYEQA